MIVSTNASRRLVEKSGKYEIILNPQNTSTFMKRAIESSINDKVQLAVQSPTLLADANKFTFNVVDMYLYLSTVEGPSVDNLSYFMSLEETRCQTDNVDNNANLQQKNFDVSPAAYALTCAFQDQRSGTNTVYSASKFKFESPRSVNADRPGRQLYPSGEQALRRFYIQYNGENKPSPDGDPDYKSPNDFLSSRYAESQLYSGAYWDCGSAEDKLDWFQRGLYMYFSYPKDGSSESTRVNVNYQFQDAPGANKANVLLFDHFKKMVLISIVNGRVVDVIEQDG